MASGNQLRCKVCRATKVVKNGRITTQGGQRQRYKCQKCGATFYAPKARGSKQDAGGR